MASPPSSQSRSTSGVRLAELLAVLSLGADLGMGQPMEHAVRQCLIALRLGEHVGLTDEGRTELYFGSLIAWVGCHVDAYEQAKWFGDDLALKDGFRHYDLRGPGPMAAMMSAHLGRGRPLGERARTVVAFAARGRRDVGEMLANHWFAADRLAEAVGLEAGVRTTVLQTFERWDGKGAPYGASGDQICLASRIVNLADVLEVFQRREGSERALEVAHQRAGTQFDPALVDVVVRFGDDLFRGLDSATSWDAVIAGEPGLARRLTDVELDLVLEAFADFIDIKSPYTLGHSRGVADLATTAAGALALTDDEVRRLRRAALLHDLGRLGVSNAVWDKPGALTSAEAERVRLHPYLTERMLAACPGLAPLGEIAVQHHERLDGSGYPRGLRGDALTVAGRVLAAADAYHAKREVRPHRAALTQEEAASWLRSEVRAGRFDGEAVDAVLAAAGHAVRRRKDWPAGLTTREVEVLRLLARGLSNRQIAGRLTISRRTVDNHVDHVYTKLGVSNRARASLVAVRFGLMSVTEDGGSSHESGGDGRHRSHMLLTEFTSRVVAEVSAPATDVFATLTDVARLPEWNARIDRVVEPLDGPMCVGAVWVVQIKLPAPPTSWPSRATCTTYDAPGLSFGHRSVTDDGNASYVEWRWQVTPVTEASARVEVVWAVNPRTFWRRLLLARVRRPQLVAEVHASLGKLGAQSASEDRRVT